MNAPQHATHAVMHATINSPVRSSLRVPKLSRSRRLTVYGIAAAIWATGTVWVVLHYFFMTEGPFGPAPHPLEVWSLSLHGAAAFASLWLFGLLWGVHIPIGWASHRRRWSGGAMFAVTLWFILSGYALYYVGSIEIASVTAVLHWATGLASPALFLVHRFARERRRRILSEP